MSTPLLPSVSIPKIDNEFQQVAFFRLHDKQGSEYGPQLLNGIKDATEKLVCDLVVLDIFNGEPDWLPATLQKLNGYGAPVIIHPPRAARAETLDALKQAQAMNTYVKAKALGFLQEY